MRWLYLIAAVRKLLQSVNRCQRCRKNKSGVVFFASRGSFTRLRRCVPYWLWNWGLNVVRRSEKNLILLRCLLYAWVGIINQSQSSEQAQWRLDKNGAIVLPGLTQRHLTLTEWQTRGRYCVATNILPDEVPRISYPSVVCTSDGMMHADFLRSVFRTIFHYDHLGLQTFALRLVVTCRMTGARLMERSAIEDFTSDCYKELSQCKLWSTQPAATSGSQSQPVVRYWYWWLVFNVA